MPGVSQRAACGLWMVGAGAVVERLPYQLGAVGQGVQELVVFHPSMGEGVEGEGLASCAQAAAVVAAVEGTSWGQEGPTQGLQSLPRASPTGAVAVGGGS